MSVSLEERQKVHEQPDTTGQYGLGNSQKIVIPSNENLNRTPKAS